MKPNDPNATNATANATPNAHADSFSLEFDLRHPPQKVWRALTDPVLMNEWLLPVVEQKLALERGTAFKLQTQAFPGWDGIVSCRVLELEAHKKLSYTWDVPFLQTVVTFTLAPTTSGTHLTLVQSGFKPEQKQELGGARYGWNMMCERLVELLAKDF